MQQTLNSTQKKHFRGMAMGLKAEIFVGKAGITANVIRQMQRGLEQHELIKVRFTTRPKAEKEALCTELETATESCLCGMVGHAASFYKQHPDPEKQQIALPQ